MFVLLRCIKGLAFEISLPCLLIIWLELLLKSTDYMPFVSIWENVFDELLSGDLGIKMRTSSDF